MATQDHLLSESDFAICKWLVRRGIENSINGLSRMLGEKLTVIGLDMNQIPLEDTIQYLGGPDNMVVGIHLDIYGDTTGHFLLVHDTRLAFQLIGNQMGLPPRENMVLGEIELSLLGEVGNIVGAFFLNVLADATNIVLSPSPPVLKIDKASIVIRNAAENWIVGQYTQFIVRASFVTGNKQINGTFLIIPTMELMNNILLHARNT